MAQNNFQEFGENNQFDSNDNTFRAGGKRDSTKAKKEFPRGMHVWTVDRYFGDRNVVAKDTLQHLFYNTGLTYGKYGEYSTTGNLGSPRLSRIFINRSQEREIGFFTRPLDYFFTQPEHLRFTNTFSPITNISYYTCGNNQNGEDYLRILFASNVNKRLGFGFKFNYMYGRGYYQSQSTSLMDFSFWTSYIGGRYQAHFFVMNGHVKLTENGGITNDDYITHPESFRESYTESEIPVCLSNNWNSYDGTNVFLTHRYNVGFNRKVPMTPEEIEARKFAMKSQAEADAKKAAEGGENESLKGIKDAPAARPGGRPDDAKIKGELSADSVKTSLSQRIQVQSDAVADSLIAEANKEKNDTSWLKDEYVPVTSFIHTVNFNTNLRQYIAYSSPSNYYLDKFAVPGSGNDSIYDETRHYQVRNTLAVALLEGFNKWVKSGMKLFLTSDIRHYELPDTVGSSKSYLENNVLVGAQLSKTQGRVFHYCVTGQLGLLGEDMGDIKADATADVNIPVFGDTVRLDLDGFFHRQSTDFYMRHYHSKHVWWDGDQKKQTHIHIGGSITLPKTRTRLRAGIDNITDYSYLAMSYERDASSNLPVKYQVFSRQSSKNISLFTAEATQDLRYGIFNWENKVTFQHSTDQDILPVPTFNVWSNLYLKFRIAKVLDVHMGADATWFSQYEAPEYCAQLMQYAVQENQSTKTLVGNYPFVNLYANFKLKGCRFFAMYSHVTHGALNRKYFTTAHYPTNASVFRIGISWDFFN